MAKLTMSELRTQLVYAQAREQDGDWTVRMTARADVRRLKARIARRERDAAMRDLGLTKVRGALGRTHYE